MARCYFCGASIDSIDRVYRSTECPHCGGPVKICVHCKFYAPGSHYDCKENITEPVKDKEQSNFCDYFVLDPGAGKDREKEAERKKKAKEKLNKLFGDE